MDRRQYLGLTGASIVALLGGCSSSDGGGQSSESTETATGTPFRNESGTPTNVGTPTPKITTTATSTPTPESGPWEGLLERKARDTGLSTKAVRWMLEESTHDEPYGLSEDQAQRILEAEPGRQFEVAVSMLNPSKYDAGLQVDDSGFDLPTKELTDEVAKDLRTIFQHDLQLNDNGEPVHYNNVLPQSRAYAHRNIITYGIFSGNENNLSAAHPKDKKLDQNHVANSSEIADYHQGNLGGLSTVEDYIATAFITRYRNNNQSKLLGSTYIFEDSESVLTDSEGATSAAFQGLHELYGQNVPVIDQGKRDNMALQMSKAGLKVLDHKTMPQIENRTAEVRDPLPYMAIADAVYEQEGLDLYEDELPSNQAIRVGSKGSENKEFEVTVDNVDDIDFTQMPATI